MAIKAGKYSKRLAEILNYNNFRVQGNRLIEKAFALDIFDVILVAILSIVNLSEPVHLQIYDFFSVQHLRCSKRTLF